MIYTFGEWELDVGRYELRSAGKSVKLEPQVFSVLAYLVEHRDRVVSKQELLTHLWPDQFIGDSALERCIMAARKAIGDSGGQQRFIKTFHRRGYRFVATVIERAAPWTSSVSVAAPHEPVADAPHAPFALADAMTAEPSHMTVLIFGLSHPQELAAALAPEALQAFLQRLFDCAAHHMQDYDGMMVPCTDRRFLALFGPSPSSLDHPWRAVQAAFDLLRHLGTDGFGLDLPVERLSASVALHTGAVIGRRFGDALPVIYMAVGDTMQVAANLQLCADPGSVVATETTYRLVQNRVEGQIVGLVWLQPEALPVAAYRIHRMRPQNADDVSYGRPLTMPV
jgi:DNA-binding winged helix-turn-helix (wHTH) protein